MAKQPIIALVDADYLEYAAGFAGQHTSYLLMTGDPELDMEVYGVYDNKPDMDKERKSLVECGTFDDSVFSVWERTEVEPIENVLHSCKRMLHTIRERVEAKFEREVDMRLYLTGSGNFREQIATIRPYKGNRRPWHKPRLQPEIREYLKDVWQAQVVYGQEADDEVCILQTQLEKEGVPSVICGIDKDLLQCPGWHYDTNKDKFVRISQPQGDVLFYKQLLTGDTTDNIPGCFRAGAKAAKEMIQALKGRDLSVDELRQELYAECVRRYQASVERYGELTGYHHMPVEDVVLEQGRLLWMRRERDEMWEPPK